jgi:ABC-type antimicrobial peptide transport system permease subunit
MTSFNTYLLLGDHVNPETLETKLPEVVKKYMAPMVEKFSGQSFESLVATGNINLEFFLQPLRRIHLFSDLRSELGVNSDIAYVYIFSAIAFFILLIAAVNFMNLSTARSANRTREVGIRKVLGSMRSQLIRQFLTESIIISIISVIIALVLVNLTLPLLFSLRDHIGPLVMFLGQGRGSSLITFRIDARNIPGTIDLIRQKWQAFLLGQPFEYYFLGEAFDRQYRDEQRLGQIFGVFAVLSIFVSCLGLFGLAAFISQQRTKEIGIRKTLGASVSSIIRLLSQEFVILVAIANAIAWPIAYLVMNRWLQDFAYRTSLKLTTFVIAGVCTMIIALLTTSYQAVKAAVSDPVKAIKYE